MKKPFFIPFLAAAFLFAQEVSDTVILEEINELNDSAIVLEEAEVTSDGATTLTIITKPSAASILLNRKRIGNTPFTVENLNPEEQVSVMLLKDGFEFFDTTITITQGIENILAVNLVSDNTVAKTVATDTVKTAATDSVTDSTTVSDDEKAAKKKKMNRIGIITFLSVMFALIFMQEYNKKD